MLEANTAMKSIVRRQEYLRRLLQEKEGVENPTDGGSAASIACGRISMYQTNNGCRRPMRPAVSGR